MATLAKNWQGNGEPDGRRAIQGANINCIFDTFCSLVSSSLSCCVSIAVAWHRLVILNERPGCSGCNIATKDLWRYVAAAIALFLIPFPSGDGHWIFVVPCPPPRIRSAAVAGSSSFDARGLRAGDPRRAPLDFAASGAGDRRHVFDFEADLESNQRKYLALVLGQLGHGWVAHSDRANCLFVLERTSCRNTGRPVLPSRLGRLSVPFLPVFLPRRPANATHLYPSLPLTPRPGRRFTNQPQGTARTPLA